MKFCFALILVTTVPVALPTQSTARPAQERVSKCLQDGGKLAFCNAMYAQNSSSTQSPPIVEQQKVVSGQQVESSFDKFNQHTHYRVDTGNVGPASLSNGERIIPLIFSRVTLIAAFDCPGQSESCVPGVAELVVSAHTTSWLLSDNRQGVALVDGRRLDLGAASWDGRVLEADDLVEYLDFNISPATLAKIANASEVSIQLGGLIDFDLLPENLLALRNLSQHLITGDSPADAAEANKVTAATQWTPAGTTSHEPQSLGAFGISRDRGSITITRLVPGGPAQRAGLAIDDRITAINGRAVKQVLEESELFSKHDEVRVSYTRGTGEAKVTLLLGVTR